MNIQAYLAFNGNCHEALKLYSEIFNAEINNRQTYADKKIDVPESYRKQLQHAELKGEGVHIMAYDAAPDTPITSGNQIHMSVDSNNLDEARTVFEKLSQKGKIHHDFRERARGFFGRCSDVYGINWMVNCNK